MASGWAARAPRPPGSSSERSRARSRTHDLRRPRLRPPLTPGTPESEVQSRPGRLVDYPRGRLFAVIDDPTVAERARTDLIAAGLGDAVVLVGTEVADAIDATGRQHGVGGRLIRAVQFLL